jgi:molybdate transport system substrate-binding protein
VKTVAAAARHGKVGVWRGAAILSLCLMGEAAPAHAERPIPPDITILCDESLRRPLLDVAGLWRERTGVPVHIIASPTPLVLQQITHHIRSDFVVAQGDVADAAAGRWRGTKPETAFGGWRNRLVLVAAGPAQSPPLSPENAAALIESGGIAIIDVPGVDVPVIDSIGATAAANSKKALETAGLWEVAQQHAIGVAGAADAVFLVEGQKARLAVVYATDIAGDPALSIVAPFPVDSYAPVTYWVAQTTTVRSTRADAFEAFLRQPEAQQQLRADGLEITP